MERKRPLSVRAILQQPGAKKVAKAKPSAPQVAGLPAHNARDAGLRVAREEIREDQLWQEMRRAEKPKACAASAAAKSRAVKRKAQPKAKGTPASRQKPPQEPMSDLWLEMRSAEAHAQLPASAVRPELKPSRQWSVRNLTHEQELFDKTSGLRSMRLERQKLLEQEAASEHSLTQLRLTKETSLAGGEPEGDWHSCLCAAESAVKQSAEMIEEALEVQRQLQRNAAQLLPGPELLQGKEDVQEAHSVVHQLNQQLKDAKRRQEAATCVIKLQKQLATDMKHQRRRVERLEHLRREIQDLERQPLLRELTEGTSASGVLPPVVLHIKPSKELLTAFQTQPLPFRSVLGLLEAEWALHFPQDALTLPLMPFMSALQARAPQRDPVLLLLGREGTSRYFQVNLPTAEAIMAYAQRPPDAVPSCIDLLRSLTGLDPQVLVHRKAREVLSRTLQCQTADAPPQLKGVLRKYQAQGFQWLASNAENGIGSLLADDMGLGKTLQCAAVLDHLHSRGHITAEQPALVVVPFSVLGNWQKELRQWTPALRFQIYHGKGRSLEGGEVLLTTYSVLQLDVEKLADMCFSAIVLDESQNIKNSQSLTAKAVKRIATASGNHCARLALSGTPIENRLGELHSLFEFLNPGFLGTKEGFLANFERPMKKGEGHAALARLHAALRPFMLRRLKCDKAIAPELPDKVEFEYSVEMTQEQCQLYMSWSEHLLRGVSKGLATPAQDLEDLEDAPKSSPSFNRRAAVLTLLHRLQQ
ncbi:unnamed protein product, partial [Effrenium voratum]